MENIALSLRLSPVPGSSRGFPGCPLPACRGRWAQPVGLRSEGVLPPFGCEGPVRGCFSCAVLRVRRSSPALLRLCRRSGTEAPSDLASLGHLPHLRWERTRFVLCRLLGAKVLSDFASRGCPLPACRGRWAQPVALRSEGVLPPFGYGGPRPGLLRLCRRSGTEAPSDLASLGHLPHLRWERTRGQ